MVSDRLQTVVGGIYKRLLSAGAVTRLRRYRGNIVDRPLYLAVQPISVTLAASAPKRTLNLPVPGNTMRTKISCLMFWSLVATSATTALAGEAAPAFIGVQPDAVAYEPDPENPELGYAVLSGDPDKAGVYVIRLRIPPGLTFSPHYHDQDRHITVISGVWAFGKGRSGRCEDTVPMKAGSYVMHPKGGIHFDGACGDEPVEVQIIGEGPVKTTRVDESE